MASIEHIQNDVRDIKGVTNDARDILGRIETRVGHLPSRGFYLTVACSGTLLIGVLMVFWA